MKGMKFDKDKKPLCTHCGKPMINTVDQKTGMVSLNLWKCTCEGYPKGIILATG